MKKDIKQVIVVRKDLNMRKGKLASQVAHASMMFLIDNNEAKKCNELHVKLSNTETMWMSSSFKKVVCFVDNEDQLKDLIIKANISGIECHSIVDAGKTTFKGKPMLTCAAFGPAEAADINEITGRLKLI